VKEDVDESVGKMNILYESSFFGESAYYFAQYDALSIFTLLSARDLFNIDIKKMLTAVVCGQKRNKGPAIFYPLGSLDDSRMPQQGKNSRIPVRELFQNYGLFITATQKRDVI